LKIKSFEWDDANVAHVGRHGVSPDEAEEVFIGSPKVFKSRLGRYVALGKSFFGRYLFVVFDFIGKKTARVITARNMTQKEKRLFNK